MDSNAALQHQIGIAGTWRRLHWWWYAVFYGLSMATILLSTLVAAKPAYFSCISETGYEALAWLLAATTATLTLFRPNDKAVRYRQAWMGLTVAIDRFQAIDDTAFETVLDAREEGEKLVHQIST